MIDRKELELLVRAQIQGGKDLEAVAKSISKIGSAIDDQSEAAKRGENRIDELKATLESLNATQKELTGFGSAIKTFTRLADGVQTAEQRLASATKRYDDYQAKLNGLDEVTDKQQATLIRYSTAVQKAAEQLDKQKKALDTVTAEFQQAGIAINDLAALQARSIELQGELGLVYTRGTATLKGYADAVREARQAQADQARQAQAAADAAAQFEKAEKAALAAAQKRAQAYQDLQDARINRNAENAAQQRLDAEVAAANKRKQELDALRRDITERSAQAAIDKQAADTAAALKKQADGAVESARQFMTLARAADNLKPKVASLRDTIADVLNPEVKARSTLSGLESEVTGIVNAVSKAQGPVEDYKLTVDRLNAAQKALQTQSGMIDAFNRQMTAVRAARAEFVTARADVIRYAAEVAKGGDSAQQFVSKLAQAEGRLKSASATLAQQVAAARQQRDTLRGAGISTTQLSDAQSRLVNIARQTVEAMKSLSSATEKYGQASESVRKSQGLFRDEGRTTLSYMQRLRGEVLSLVAAYGGLFTVINTAKGAVDAAVTRDTVRNQIAISVGNDRQLIDEEYAYVKQQSDRIGLEFERAAKGYAKFAASATLAGRSRQEIRYIWEAFAEVGRVANLSADDLDGVFKALDQIVSKGKIQAEELRGQLGDRLFGAFQIAAKALKDEFPNLDKAMEKGEVTSEQLIRIAEEYRRTVGEQLPGATAGLVAQQARLNNAIYDFQLAIADSGFLESYTRAVKRLTEFLKSESGQEAARGLGKLFSALADTLILVLDNLDLVIAGFVLFATAFTYKRLASGIGALEAIIANLKLTGTSATIAAGAMGLLRNALIALAVFAVGWQIGSIMYDKFKVVRDAGAWLVTGLFELWAIIKASFSATFEALPAVAREMFEKVVNAILTGAKKVTGIFADMAAAVGLDDLAARLRTAQQQMSNTVKFAGESSSSIVERYRKALAAERKQIQGIRADMLADQAAIEGATTGGSATPTASPGVSPRPKTKGEPTASEIAKRQSEIEAIQRAIEAIEAKTDRAQTESLASQLEAIDTQYAALSRRIEALGGETGKKFMAALNSAITGLRQTTIDKFNKGLGDSQDALLKKTETSEAAAGKKQKNDLDARLAAIVTEYESTYRELADLRLKFFQNDRDTSELDAIKERLDAAKKQRLAQEEIKFNTEELDRREKAVNETIAARDKLLAAVQAQKEAGQIDDEVAAQRINQINAEYTAKINANIEATRQWALANAAVFGNPEAQQVFLATLDAIQAKVNGVKTEFTTLQAAIISGGVNTINQALNSVADAFGQIITGQQTVSEGFKGMTAAFAQFAAAFLRDIALMIIKLMIFKALQNSGNPILAAIGSAGQASMGVRHDGGVIGYYGGSNRTRSVDASWFTAAPRYHTGGIAGLAPDEYPTILQKGEEVLSKDSPRNIMNGGMGIGQNTQQGEGGGTRFVLVDDRSRIPEAMSGADGDRVIVQSIKRNLPTLKAMLK